jgi:hypothetical protein
MEQYTKYLKDKKVIFGLVVVVAILFNTIKGCGSCEEKSSCDSDQAMHHICTPSCNHGGV